MTKPDPFDALIQKLEKLPLPMAPDPFDPFKRIDDEIEEERRKKRAAKAAKQPPAK